MVDQFVTLPGGIEWQTRATLFLHHRHTRLMALRQFEPQSRNLLGPTRTEKRISRTLVRHYGTD
jgi:hypothetical protein